MPTYVDDAAIVEAMSARLGADPNNSVRDSPHWDKLAKEANQNAYDFIRETLIGGGFTAAQVDAWDYRSRYNLQIAICYLLRSGAVFKDYDLEAIEKQCKVIEDLEQKAEDGIVIGGVLVEPVDATAGAGYGMGPSGIEGHDLDIDEDLS